MSQKSFKDFVSSLFDMGGDSIYPTQVAWPYGRDVKQVKIGNFHGHIGLYQKVVKKCIESGFLCRIRSSNRGRRVLPTIYLFGSKEDIDYEGFYIPLRERSKDYLKNLTSLKSRTLR